MNKIPVRKTIAYAYSFTLGNLGAIIGLSWVPLVLVAVLQFLPYAGGHNPMIAPDNPAQAGQQALLSMGSSFLALLLYSMVYVAVTRQALGLRQGGAMIHFALGAPELRVFGAFLLFVLVLIGMMLAFAIVLLLLGAAAASMPAVIAVAVLAGVAAFFYVIVRLGFLLPTVTVAEEKIDLARGWLLTAGNFWRLFVVVLAITLPVFVVFAIGLAVIVGPGFFAPLPQPGPAITGSGALGLLQPNSDLLEKAMNARMALLDQKMPMYIGLSLMLAPFSLGLNLGAAAFAYRILVPRGVQA